MRSDGPSLRGIRRKWGFALLLLTVLLLSYFVAFFLISLTPYGHYSARVYSAPQTSDTSFGNSSTMGGAWLEQLLWVHPLPGAKNVPRDTSIIIDAARPARLINLSFSPNVTIAEEQYLTPTQPAPPSSTQIVYPAGLLEPNTTYNVSAIVAGTASWWIFTTSSEPSHLTFGTHISPNDTWFAFTAAIFVTSGVALGIFLQRKNMVGFLGNSSHNLKCR